MKASWFQMKGVQGLGEFDGEQAAFVPFWLWAPGSKNAVGEWTPFLFFIFLEGMTPLAFSDQGTRLQCSEDSTKMVIMFRES